MPKDQKPSDQFPDSSDEGGEFVPKGSPEQDVGNPTSEGSGEADSWPESKGIGEFGGFQSGQKIDRTKGGSVDLPKKKVFPSPGE